ncbi:MAG: hypothetical protein ACRETO_12205 [Gammaproteobacteria bacterium]
MTATASAFADQNNQASATAATVPAPAATSLAKPATTNLSKVQVTGIRELVHTLQTVKVALKRHFNNDPKRVNEMICEINGGLNPTLECGTQGWYRMRREAYHLGFLPAGNGFAGGELGQAAVPYLGHPWHVVHPVNHTQLMYLRKLLKKLPSPDANQKILVKWDERHASDQNNLHVRSDRMQ